MIINFDKIEEKSIEGFKGGKGTLLTRMADDGKIGTLLHKLYLMPGKTGHRYGEHIFHAVETRAKTAGESWLWLEVLAANPAARRFYERQGMQHIRDTTFHSASQQSTLHILAKPI